LQYNLGQKQSDANVAANTRDMKNFLFLMAVSAIMTIGTMLPLHHENVPHFTLPEVQITSKRVLSTLPEINLPMVTIHAEKVKMNIVVLPEVVITAKFKKV